MSGVRQGDIHGLETYKKRDVQGCFQRCGVVGSRATAVLVFVLVVKVMRMEKEV